MRRVLDRTLSILLVAAFACSVLGGCSSGGALPAASFATGGEVHRAYRLRVGDKLKVTVFGETNLSGTYEVNPLGRLSLPLVGEVAAKGVTVAGLRNDISRRYASGYLKNPKVTVEVTNYRPIFVHGEVKNGGEFAFRNGLQIRDVVAMAGGFTYRANQAYVVIVRSGHPAARLSLPSTLQVLPGDNIKVEERFF